MGLSDSQYKVLSDIVYSECGINLHEGKLELLKARVAKRLRITKINSLEEYINLIKQDTTEFINFIDAVSTNHTFFFRENHHCEFLLKNIDNSRHLKIWSAASSSGEEPYSIAIQLLEKGAKFEMFASDISNSMIKAAKTALYYKEKLRLVPRNMLIKYFQKGRNKWEGYVRVKKEVMNNITFGRHNLIVDSSPGIFNIIFCRNVMIYFDNETKQKVIGKLYKSLAEGGYLIIGAAEGLVGLKHNFKYIKPSIYIKGAS